jgi:Mg-chelatase subunit ChlD
MAAYRGSPNRNGGRTFKDPQDPTSPAGWANLPVAYAMQEGPVAAPMMMRRPEPAVIIQTLSPAAKRQLKEQGFTNGLMESLEVNKRALPLSIWVVDNSGSMVTVDGHHIVALPNRRYKFVNCPRWREMQETVDYHCQLASLLRSPTTFRLLNPPGAIAGPQTFEVGRATDPQSADHELAIAQSVMMNSQPGGVTPLAMHIHEIRTLLITEIIPTLNNAKVTIVLATDGLPTDARGYSNSFVQQQFADALRSLEGLPVWIVVRLCTDDEEVVSYWNNLDSQVELSLEVLVRISANALKCAMTLEI